MGNVSRGFSDPFRVINHTQPRLSPSAPVTRPPPARDRAETHSEARVSRLSSQRPSRSWPRTGTVLRRPSAGGKDGCSGEDTGQLGTNGWLCWDSASWEVGWVVDRETGFLKQQWRPRPYVSSAGESLCTQNREVEEDHAALGSLVLGKAQF